MRHRAISLVGAGALVVVGVLVCAGPAAAQLPGVPGLPGAGGIGDVLGGVGSSLGLPSIDDIVSKVVGSLFGALADALLPDFLKHDSVGVMGWLVSIPNPAAGSSDSDLKQLLALMQASGGALLVLTSLVASTRALLPGGEDTAPIQVVQRSVLAAGAIVAYPWLVGQLIGLANVVSTGLLQTQVVSEGMKSTVGTVFGATAFGGTASGAYLGMLTLGAILMATGLFAVHVMLLYLVPALVVAGPLLLPFHALRSTEHLPRTWAITLGGLAIIPVGWCILFSVAGALSSDLHSGALGRAPGGETILGANTLAAFVVLILYAAALWWPWAVLSHARSIVGAFGISHGPGPVQRGMSLAGTALRLKFLAALAAGGAAGFAAGRAGGGGRPPRLAADTPASGPGWTPSSRGPAAAGRAPTSGAAAADADGSHGTSTRAAAGGNAVQRVSDRRPSRSAQVDASLPDRRADSEHQPRPEQQRDRHRAAGSTHRSAPRDSRDGSSGSRTTAPVEAPGTPKPPAPAAAQGAATGARPGSPAPEATAPRHQLRPADAPGRPDERPAAAKPASHDQPQARRDNVGDASPVRHPQGSEPHRPSPPDPPPPRDTGARRGRDLVDRRERHAGRPTRADEDPPQPEEAS